MFKFEFADEQEKETILDSVPSTATLAPAIRILPSHINQIISTEFISCGDTKILKRMLSDVKFQLISTDESDQASMTSIIQTQSDLIPNIYEGGLKTWECSMDLVQYLSSIKDSLPNKRIMELGCGSALPGIYASTQGANVDFQDYNTQVLKLLTIPNVMLNMDPNAVQNANSGEYEFELNYETLNLDSQMEFWAGDWSLLVDKIESQKYDLVITSETIYSRESHIHLLRLIKHLLKKDGIALIAAKSCYFGCSGSLNQFLNLCNKECKSVKSVFRNSESVTREIIELTF